MSPAYLKADCQSSVVFYNWDMGRQRPSHRSFLYRLLQSIYLYHDKPQLGWAGLHGLNSTEQSYKSALAPSVTACSIDLYCVSN